MSIKTDLLKQRKKLKDIFGQRQPSIKNILAITGDGQGHLKVTNRPGFIYVTINDHPHEAYCGKIAIDKIGQKVLLGKSIEEGQKGSFYQVLSNVVNNATDASLLETGGYAPASRYAWGGIDPLGIDVRAISFLRLGVSVTGGLNVDLGEGFVESGSARYFITRQDLDLTAQLPSTAGKAAFVLLTIDNTGTVVQTKGAEADITDLDPLTDIPMSPVGTVFECGAVRVYTGQTEFREAQANTDFVDLRFIGYLRNPDIFVDAKDPTGWLDPAAVCAATTYDSSTQKITVTGTFYYYWRGIKKSVTNLVSTAHTNTVGHIYRLFSTDGITFTWSTDTEWAFSDLQLASVNYQTAYKYATTEAHGLMQWQVHDELHHNIGTYKNSGGTLDPASYTLNSATATNRRPDVVATYIQDEDIPHTLAALTSKTYNKFSLSLTDTVNFSGLTAEIVSVTGAQPNYNLFTGGAWTQAALPVNNHMCIWLVAQPCTQETNSQTFRYFWVQGQSAGTLASQQALSPLNVSLGALQDEEAEFIFLQKIIIQYIAADWKIIQVDTLSGNRFLQVASPSGNFLSGVTTNGSLTGNGTTSNPLSASSGETTVTAAGTTTLTVNSATIQEFTGTTTQTVVLPVVTTLRLGHQFMVVNNSTGAVTVNSSGGNAVIAIPANAIAVIICIAITGTTASSWSSLNLIKSPPAGTYARSGDTWVNIASSYAPAGEGVTNGNSHDHSGGDGAQIDYNGLANLPSLKGRFVSVAVTGLIDSAAGNWSTGAKNTGTYTFRPGDNSNIWPSSATAIVIRMGSRWATASNTTYLSVRRSSGGSDEFLVRALVGSIASDAVGTVAVDGSGYFYAVIGGANSQSSSIQIIGYLT